MSDFEYYRTNQYSDYNNPFGIYDSFDDIYENEYNSDSFDGIDYDGGDFDCDVDASDM